MHDGVLLHAIQERRLPTPCLHPLHASSGRTVLRALSLRRTVRLLTAFTLYLTLFSCADVQPVLDHMRAILRLVTMLIAE